MQEPDDCFKYQPLEASAQNEPADFGYYGFDSNIARALCQKSHLGYTLDRSPWETRWNDFGYYALNAGITQALKRLAGR